MHRNKLALFAVAVCASIGVIRPGLAQVGVRMGDNNRVAMDGTVNGAQTATAIGLGANAQNGVASIMSGAGTQIGNNNNLSLTGKMNGAQTATAIGLGANAQNGVASIMAANH